MNIEFKDSYDFWTNILKLKMLSMFEYNNVPAGINERLLKTFNLTDYMLVFFDIENELHCVTGTLSCGQNESMINEWNEPNGILISNPILRTHNFTRMGSEQIYENESGKAIPIFNNTLHTSDKDLIERYATMLANCDVSIDVAQVNTRLTTLISTDDEIAYKSAMEYMDKMKEGKTAICMTSSMISDLKHGISVASLIDTNTSDILTRLSELHQFIYASFLHSIGINATVNEKKERMITDEVNINEQLLQVNIKDMLMCRQEAISNINKIFGTNITVELGEEWKRKEVVEDIVQTSERNK